MGLKQIRQQQEEARRNRHKPSEDSGVELKRAVIGQTKIRTATKMSSTPIKELIQQEHIASEGLPMGYHAIGKNDVAQLMLLKEKIIKIGICSLDYEANNDTDNEDNTDDPQDWKMCGCSVACEIGQAFYLPVAHDNYGANWDTKWLVDNFLKPILEDPNIRVIAHNAKFEHQISILLGIDFAPKARIKKVVDTMLLVKALAHRKSLGFDGRVIVGLKPSTKTFLADETTGLIHGLLSIDDVQSFKDTVGFKEVPIPGEFYKSGPKKGQAKTTKVQRTFNELPIDKKTVDYGCSDADWALGLYYKILPMCEREDLMDVLWEIDFPFMLTLGEMEMAGWHINRKGLENMRGVAESALAKIMPDLNIALGEVTEGYADFDDDGNIIVPDGFYGMGIYKGKDSALEIKVAKPFNWASTQHQQWLFFHVMKVNYVGLKRSKTTHLISCGKENMDKIVDRFEGDTAFIKLLKEKKKYDKILSTYVNGMLPFARQDTDKIHSNMNLVATWRLSSKKPNLQNIPRADNDPLGIRKIFEAPTYIGECPANLNKCTSHVWAYINSHRLSGETFFIGCDYSQIELKVLAWYANDITMINVLANGGDLHSAVAKEINHLDCTIEEVKKLYKPQRYRAKKVNFGIVYGLTEYGLADDPQMGMNTSEAKVFIDRYMARFPGVRSYAEAQIAFAREHGYVVTMFNHRRAIPDINHPNKWIRQSAENQCMNTPIQGSAADIIRKAMVELGYAIKDSPTHKYLSTVMQIHDELQVECPVEYASEGALFVKEVMERPIPGFSNIMPIIAEPAIGKIWGHALDIKWEANGKAFVTPKKEKHEATDVTIAEIQYALPLYKLAGIEVRI